MVVPCFAGAQIISTFAGCGTSCTGLGDGGPATAAVILDPNCGFFDKYGNYYFGEGPGQRIRKIDTSGIIITIAGTGTGGFAGDGFAATAALLNTPGSVILDTSGNVYFVDLNNIRIRKIEVASGIIKTIAGNGTNGFYGDGLPSTVSVLSAPSSICFDKHGNLYISDQNNYRVRKINPAGIISTFAGSGGFSATGTGDGGQATNATFNMLAGLVSDKIGNIYISDANAAKVRKVDTFGIITTVAGNGNYTYAGDGVPATNAQIDPIRLAIDSSGNLIINDRVNDRVYRVDNADILHTIAGTASSTYGGDGGPATAASFDACGVSFDPCWNLYIADLNNRRIRKITYNPTCDPYSHGHIDSASLQTKEPVGGKIAIYPNPAYSSLTISSTQKIKQVIIANFMGEEVYTGVYDIEKAEVNIAGLPEGVFVVRVTDDEGSVTMSKIVKQ